MIHARPSFICQGHDNGDQHPYPSKFLRAFYTHTQIHTHMQKTTNSPACVFIRENLEKSSSKVAFGVITWVKKWVSFECIWYTLYLEKWWQVLRQRKLTTERTVIKETLPPNGVREVAVLRCSNDFHYSFTVWQSYYADGLTASKFISMHFSTMN